MSTVQHKDLLNAGVHFGHMTKKWNPNMAQFIFMKRNNMHVIDLNKTLVHLQEAANSLKAIARSGKKILFVATKKQAKAIVEQEATRLTMPYVTERWLGGTLTNFVTIRRLLKKWASFEKLMKSPSFQNLAKREQLTISREKNKLSRLLQGISDVTRLPAAIFVVDINREHIAVKEAKKLGILLYALGDTDANPDDVDFLIPGNDDSTTSIALIVKTIGKAIEEGLAERQKEKDEAPKIAVAENKDGVVKVASSSDRPNTQRPKTRTHYSDTRNSTPVQKNPRVQSEQSSSSEANIIAKETEKPKSNVRTFSNNKPSKPGTLTSPVKKQGEYIKDKPKAAVPSEKVQAKDLSTEKVTTEGKKVELKMDKTPKPKIQASPEKKAPEKTEQAKSEE